MHVTRIITEEERQAISYVFAQCEMNRCRDEYRDARSKALEIKSISFPNGPELAQAIQARKEWSEASKRVSELEKEVCK
jgi:hypothetical protein